ncbi:MAG: nucleotidyl transferase AbiEii/AbiGii toxin family protein [Deltaproteobacteria bacterium]|nr:nucleotidyl transferase AbiEii/AbiGii toxin family protein [Deltaproteobacteria bacterium]
MDRLGAIMAEARAQGLRPWIAVKERLARSAVEVMAGAPAAVLQGGAALHFVYGSPRLSADVDFVGAGVARAIETQGPEIARAASEAVGRPATWSMTCHGRLLRGKVAIELGPARRLVLPVEAYQVPAHRIRLAAPFGPVEEPEEITADKAVASADRLARRGALKTRDLFDLWFILARLGSAGPDAALVAAKAADYGLPRRDADLAAAVRAIPEEELRSALQGVLPASELGALRLCEVVEAAATVLGSCQHVL